MGCMAAAGHWVATTWCGRDRTEVAFPDHWAGSLSGVRCPVSGVRRTGRTPDAPVSVVMVRK
jgi:hypothetical protein